MNVIDVFPWLQNGLDQLIAGSAPFFVAKAGFWLRCLAGVILVLKFFIWARSKDPMGGFIHFVFQLAGATIMLHFWANPLPWGGSSLGQLIPDQMNQLSAFIDTSAVSEAQAAFSTAYANLETPVGTMIPSLSDALVWGVTVSNMWLSQALMFGINIVGYLAVGLGVFLGPLFIPWMMWPKWSFLTTSIFVYLLEFSLWRLVATALTYVFAKAWVLFFSNAVRGDYSILHFSVLLTGMLMLGVGQIWCFFSIPRLVTDMVKGGATAGSNLAGGIALAVRAVV